MAVALLTTYIHALLLCVLLFVKLQMSSSRTVAPDCGAPEAVTNAKVDIEMAFSETNYQYIRYKCQDGYKRQTGTSNLAICMYDNTSKKWSWKYARIVCIPDQSMPITRHSTLTSSTTSDEQHVSTTTVSATDIMNSTRSTSSGSSSSRDFTSLFTELGGLTTTVLSTTTLKVHQTSHTAKAKLNQRTQIPRHVSTTKITTIGYHHTTEGQTSQTAGSHFTSVTVGKMTERTTTQSFPESSYPSADETPKSSTIRYITTTGHDSHLSDTSWWQPKTTAGSTAGVLVFLFLIVLGIIIWIKHRKQHSRVPQEEPNLEQEYYADLNEQEVESSSL